MTIDERIEALTMNLQLVSRDIAALKTAAQVGKRFERLRVSREYGSRI